MLGINENAKVNVRNTTVEIRGHTVLKGISFEVNNGLTIISGPIGSGKTTLLRLLLNDISCKEGSVLVNGRVSYAPQEPWVFPSTLKQNILLGEKFDRNRYEEVLKVCALTLDRDRLPGGDDFMVKEQGSNISSGQKARISLARAAYRNSDVYLLDDCLRSLDIHVQEYVFKECLQRFMTGKICIFVTQNNNFFYKADGILWIENGVVQMKSRGVINAEKQHVKEPVMEEKCDVTLGDYDEADESTKLLDSKQKPNVYCEEKKSGKVEKAVYKKYIKLGGGYFLGVFIILFFIVTHTCKSYSEKMVSNWVNLEENISLYKHENIKISDDLMTRYNFTLILYSCLILGTVVLSVITATLLFNFTRTASNRLQNLMVRSIMGALMYFHDVTPIGSIINRFSKDLTVIDEQLPFVVYDFLEILFSFCGVVILLACVNLLFLIPVSVIIIIMYLMRKIYIPIGRNLQRMDVSSRSPMIGYLNASLEGLTTIRAFRVEDLLTKEFDRHQDLYTSANYTSKCCARAFGYFLDLWCSIFIATIVARFVFLDHDITVGEIGLAITQAYTLTGFVQYGIRQWAEIENKMTSVERALEYTKAEQERNDMGILSSLNWPIKGKIQFVDVSLRYCSTDSYLLKNLNFTINPAEKIGIVGRTGAGKSTLITTLFRLYDHEGEIRIDDMDIKYLQLKTIRQKITIIPQEPVLFTGTIRDNLDPFGDYDDHEIWSAIEKAGLRSAESGSNITSLEITIDDAKLSSAQKQLLSIARAVLLKNKIVIFDELTANMDEVTEKLVTDVVKENFKSCTLLVVAHKLETIVGLDKVMVLEHGAIVEYNTPAMLLEEKNGVFYNMVKSSGLLK
ncbi:unnamed protein product [Acanthoscelides obtectus]|uniref:Multidrug resistance-associated protein lethal(2)03659 n=1 Tax=Acanthoscelides obtectus TaxID=200917 RepID=A0A9P0MGM9_ACAOB|nr:unnamed protein product [Acanthoscelides obtectus]CAK1642105.1 Probable multidrug resistance-associated protein lethal(2)03659 [Acanthoscelides obtectus]